MILGAKMKYYNFQIIVNGFQINTNDDMEHITDLLAGANCDDSVISSYNKTLYLDFDREADCYEQAIMSAIKDIESIPHLKVASVDAGDYVGLSDAAELADITRSALSNYNKGIRGNGQFPAPILRITNKNPVWRWSDIASWLSANGKIEQELVDNARTVEAINMALQLRNKALLSNILAMTQLLDNNNKSLI